MLIVVWHFLRGLVRVTVATIAVAMVAAAFVALVLLGGRGTAIFRSASLLVPSPVEGC